MAILTIIFGLLGSLLKNFWPYILALLVGMYLYHRVTKWWHGDNADTTLRTGIVASIESGNRITIKAGLVGRQRQGITLYGLEIPDIVAEQAKDNLTRYIAIGDKVRLDVIGKWKLLKDNDCIILSENGTNININQLKMGLAKNTCTNKDFVWAETEAKKASIGIWKDIKPPKPHPFPWWHESEEMNVNEDKNLEPNW